MEIAAKSLYPDINTDPRISMPMDISDTFISKILRPYKENAKYLRAARILDYHEPDFGSGSSKSHRELVMAEGSFSIPESCYIAYTGYFNAVEFNICYNQLAYVLFGKCIQSGIFHRVVFDWEQRINLSYEGFLKYQFSSMFIARIEINFLKPLDARNFQARLTINRIMWTPQTAFVYTQISYSDGKGVKSTGDVLLAFRIINGL